MTSSNGNIWIKTLSKQSWGWWFETPSRPLWRHSNDLFNLRQAHSSVERAALLGAVKCHKITSDEKEQMRGDALRQAIEKDVADGLVPFFVSTGGQAGASCYCPFARGIHQWPVKGQWPLKQSHPLIYLLCNYSSMFKPPLKWGHGWVLAPKSHDDVIKWKHFPRNWPFVRGIHRSRWIPRTKASDAELWCLLWSASE